METVGQRIKRRREELGLSQDALAKMLGYRSRSSINKIELASRNLNQSQVTAIAAALQVSPLYILGVEEKNTPAEAELSEGEAALIGLFRQVPADKQRLVLDMIRAAISPKESDC